MTWTFPVTSTSKGLGPGDIAAHAETFEAAVQKLRGHLMPPPGNPRPDPVDVEVLIAWLEDALDQGSDVPGAAHVPVQRMSRTEYAAAVEDLLAVEIDPAEYLPTEMEIDGFTNMAAALSVSPVFLEQYVGVARAVARLAVGQPQPKLMSAHYPPPRTTDTQDFHTDGLPLGTRGGTRFVHNFPADGEYRFTIADLELTNYGARTRNQADLCPVDRSYGGLSSRVRRHGRSDDRQPRWCARRSRDHGEVCRHSRASDGRRP